ncbi:hypothetical protein AAMO2058_000189000 [Amorphochlora amoebiformis]
MSRNRRKPSKYAPKLRTGDQPGIRLGTCLLGDSWVFQRLYEILDPVLTCFQPHYPGHVSAVVNGVLQPKDPMSESKMEYGALESEEEGSDSVESPHDEKKSKYL